MHAPHVVFVLSHACTPHGLCPVPRTHARHGGARYMADWAWGVTCLVHSNILKYAGLGAICLLRCCCPPPGDWLQSLWTDGCVALAGPSPRVVECSARRPRRRQGVRMKGCACVRWHCLRLTRRSPSAASPTHVPSPRERRRPRALLTRPRCAPTRALPGGRGGSERRDRWQQREGWGAETDECLTDGHGLEHGLDIADVSVQDADELLVRSAGFAQQLRRSINVLLTHLGQVLHGLQVAGNGALHHVDEQVGDLDGAGRDRSLRAWRRRGCAPASPCMCHRTCEPPSACRAGILPPPPSAGARPAPRSSRRVARPTRSGTRTRRHGAAPKPEAPKQTHGCRLRGNRGLRRPTRRLRSCRCTAQRMAPAPAPPGGAERPAPQRPEHRRRPFAASLSVAVEHPQATAAPRLGSCGGETGGGGRRGGGLPHARHAAVQKRELQRARVCGARAHTHLLTW
eukprot:176344-Chlamydomonas_euryale.AAC.4